MSMIPPVVLAYRKEIADGAGLTEGLSVADGRIQQVLLESGWTIEQLDVDIKEHCLARRARSADGSKHFYEFIDPIDMPPVG